MKTCSTSWWLVCVLVLVSGGVLMKGCQPEERVAIRPANGQANEQMWTLPNPLGSEISAKALTYSILVVGVEMNANGEIVEIGPTIGPLMFERPQFPISTPVTLRVPPCLYRVTIDVTLERDPPRERSGVFNVCENDVINLSILTFEELTVDGLSIQVQPPGPVLFDTELTVSCRATQVSAPDSDRWPLNAELWEVGERGEKKNSVSSTQFNPDTGITGTFPDPFSRSSTPSQRIFHCAIRDGRSPEHTVTRTVQRIVPTPTPTPTPTCGGYLFDGKCWYLAPYLASCNTECANHGGVDTSASTFWANHTNADCNAVLDALGACMSYSLFSVSGWSDACYCSQVDRVRAYGQPHDPNGPSFSYSEGEACACVY